MQKSENAVLSAAQRGFTLVELLVVVGILGVLGAVAVTEVKDHLENSKKTAAKMAVDNIEGALTSYMIKTKKSQPPSDLKVLIEENGDDAAFLKGGEGALIDPWDNEYKLVKKGKRNFAVVSFGPDGQENTDDDIRSDKIEGKKR